MPGLFDDLVPTTAQPRAGRFDDLVPQAPKSGFVEGVKQTGRELVESGRRLGQYTRGLGLAFNMGEAQNLDELIARAEAAGDQEGAAALRAERETRLANAGEVAANIARSDQESTFKSRPVVQEIGQAQDIGGVVSAFRKDPIGAVVGFTAESAAQMAPALVAGILAGPAAGVATMGATSGASELGSTILDYAQEKGVNTQDAAALTAFYSNPANLEAATNKGGTRGAIIGALDALTGGIASKTLAPAAVKGALKRQAINIPAQMGVQMAGGGGGEALGQLATEGKITSVGAIAGEVLGELGGAPAEVAAFSKDVRTAMAARRKPLQEEIKDVLDSPDIDSAVQAADALSRANQEVDEATAEYLAEPTAPAMPGPARPTAASIDRQAELTQQSIVAGTEFERQSAAAQAQAARGEPTPGPAAEFVDLTPMNPLQARQRLTVLRDEVAQQGGNALELQIASHPAQPGALAIRRVPLPDLNLGTTVPTVGTAEAQNRIESAALAGEVSRRRNTPEEQGRQALITRAMRAIEERGGVASPEEARVLRESNMGQPYNRIDPSLSTPLREEEALTQATGLAVGRAPRETIATPTPAPDVQGERLAAQERANERSMTAFAAGAPGREQARAVGEKALQEAASRAPAPPAAAQVIEALRVAPALRAAEQKARVDQARSRYTAAEMTALELAANAPATMTAEQKLVVQRLTAAQPKASPARAALTAQGLREVTVQELPRASKPSRDGAVQLQGITREMHGLVTRMAKLYGKRVVVYEGGDGRDGFFDPKDPDTVYLNRASSKPHLVVFGHELLHSLKQSSPETYQRLEATIRGQLKEGAEQTFAEDYGAQADTEELVADLIGNRMAEESFWLEVFQGMDAPAANRLALAVASAVQKAKQVVSRMTGFKTDELVKDLDAVKNAAVAAMRQYAKQQRPAAQRLAKEEGAPNATGQVDKQAGVRQERQDGDGARQAAEAGGRDRLLGPARREQEGPPAAQRQGVAQPRAADGTFKSWSEEDELAAAEAQQKFSPGRWQVIQDNVPTREQADKIVARNRASDMWDGYDFKVKPSEFHQNGSFQIESLKRAARENNASGESAASLEAQGRLREEAARDRPRVLVERDGTVRPLTGVNAVDQRARAGQVILQKNIGKDTWTVLEQGPDVTPGMVARAIYNAGRFKASARRVDKLGFYSALEEAIGKGPGIAPASAWKDYIRALTQKGVKAEEIEWSGVNEWLDLQGAKVKREDVAQFLAQNGVQVEETKLGGAGALPEEIGRYIGSLAADERPENVEDWLQLSRSLEREAQLYQRNGNTQARRVFRLAEQANAVAEQMETDSGVAAGATKYQSYTLPGGTNYREVLLTLPDRQDAVDAHRAFLARMRSQYPGTIAERNAAMTADERAELERLGARANAQRESTPYRSNHWDQPNVLAHIRVNDRTDAEGNRVLFVEEVQSDFGQATKKQKTAIGKAVDNDFEGIVERMKKAGVLTVECD